MLHHSFSLLLLSFLLLSFGACSPFAESSASTDSAQQATSDPPVVNALLAGATVITGSATTAAAGSSVYVFVGGVFLGATVVGTGGNWILAGITPLVSGRSVTAAVTDTTNSKQISEQSSPTVVQSKKSISPPAGGLDKGPSSLFTATPSVSSVPFVNAAALLGAESISGTSAEASGAAVYVYVDNEFLGATTVRDDGSWILSGVSPLRAGQKISVAAVDANLKKSISARSIDIIVGADVAGKSSGPVVIISGPISEGDTSIRGVSSDVAGSPVYVFVGGNFVGATMVDGVGTWNLKGIRPVSKGQVISARGADSPSSSHPSPDAIAVVFETVTPGGAEDLSSPNPSKTPTADPDTDFFLGTTSSGKATTAQYSLSPTPPPEINIPVSGSTIITGTSPSPAGTVIYATLNGKLAGSTMVEATGEWTVSLFKPLTPGGVVSATAHDIAQSRTESRPCEPVVVLPPRFEGSQLEAHYAVMSETASAFGASLGTTPVNDDSDVSSSDIDDQFGSGQLPPPKVREPLFAGDHNVTGTCLGATVDSVVHVKVDGVFAGETKVATDGSWSLRLAVELQAGWLVSAAVTDPVTDAESRDSNPIAVLLSDLSAAYPGLGDGSATGSAQVIISLTPIVLSPIVAGSTTVSGTCAESAGAVIFVYINTVYAAASMVQVDGTWTVETPSQLQLGQSVTAASVNFQENKSQSSVSPAVVVSSHDGASTEAAAIVIISDALVSDIPTVDAAYAGTSEITGTSSEPSGTLIYVSIGATYVGSTMVFPDGTWSLELLEPLTVGMKISATATNIHDSEATSAPSAASIVMQADAAPKDASLSPSINVALTAPGSGSISGSSSENPGSVVYVYVNGEYRGAGTVKTDHSFQISVSTSLSKGDKVTVTVTDVKNDKHTSPPSILIVGDSSLTEAEQQQQKLSPPTSSGTEISKGTSLAPVVSPAQAGDVVIQGLCDELSGTVIFVYLDQTYIGAAILDVNKNWTLVLGIPLGAGQAITATSRNMRSGKVTSVLSSPVIVSGPAVAASSDSESTSNQGQDGSSSSSSPLISAPLITTVRPGDTQVQGTCSEEVGTVVYVFIQNSYVGGAIVQVDHSWRVLLSSALTVDQVVGAKALSVEGSGSSAETSVVVSSESESPDVSLSQGVPQLVVAPIINPLQDGATIVRGSSVEPVGTVIKIFVGSTLAQIATVDAHGFWSATTPPLASGDSLTALAVNTEGDQSPRSPSVIVLDSLAIKPTPVTSRPIILPVYEGQSIVSGTAYAPAGTVIEVFCQGVFLGSGMVQIDTSWAVIISSPVVLATVVTATATDAINDAKSSPPSVPVIVSSLPRNPTIAKTAAPFLPSGAVTSAPVVAAACVGDTEIRGSSSEPAGTAIYVYANSFFVSTTLVSADGTWFVTPGPPLSAGWVLTATATDLLHERGTSAKAKPVIVTSCSSSSSSFGASAPDSSNRQTTLSPVVTAALVGQNVVSGTSDEVSGTVIYVFVDGGYKAGTMVQGDGTWKAKVEKSLIAGQVVTATAIDVVHSGTESPHSSPVIVGASASHVDGSDASSGGSSTNGVSAQPTVNQVKSSDLSVEGSCAEKAGAVVEVFVSSGSGAVSLGLGLVEGNGKWSLKLSQKLTKNVVVVATCTSLLEHKGKSPVSFPVVVGAVASMEPSGARTPAPKIVQASGKSVAGKSTVPDGSVVLVFVNGGLSGMGLVSNGEWNIRLKRLLETNDVVTAVSADVIGRHPLSLVSDSFVSATGSASAQSTTATVPTSTTAAFTEAAALTSSAAGGSSLSASASVAPLVDIIAPDASILSGSSSESPGSVVFVFDAGSIERGIGQVQPDGTFSITLDKPASTGTILSVTVTNVLANKVQSPSSIVVVGSNAPGTVVAVSLVSASPRVNPLASRAIVVSGSSTEQAGSKVSVYVNGAFVRSTMVRDDGSWAVTLNQALSAGASVSATVTNAAANKNTSPLSAARIVGGGSSLEASAITDSVSSSLSSGGRSDAPLVTLCHSGDSAVVGTSSESSGSIVFVYVDGTWRASGFVDASQKWKVKLPEPLKKGSVVVAVVTNVAEQEFTSPESVPSIVAGAFTVAVTSDATSDASSPSEASSSSVEATLSDTPSQIAKTHPPVVSHPIHSGQTKVSGVVVVSSSESSGTAGVVVAVMINGIYSATAVSTDAASWSATLTSPLALGDSVSAVASDISSGKLQSDESSVIVVVEPILPAPGSSVAIGEVASNATNCGCSCNCCPDADVHNRGRLTPHAASLRKHRETLILKSTSTGVRTALLGSLLGTFVAGEPLGLTLARFSAVDGKPLHEQGRGVAPQLHFQLLSIPFPEPVVVRGEILADGTFSVNTPLQIAGRYLVIIVDPLDTMIDAGHKEHQFLTVQPARPSPVASIVSGPGLTGSSTEIVTPTWVQLTVRDQFGNPVPLHDGSSTVRKAVTDTRVRASLTSWSTGERHMVQHLESFSSSSSLVDKNASLILGYTCPAVGSYRLDIALDAVDVRGSPFTVNCADRFAKVSPYLSFVTNPLAESFDPRRISTSNLEHHAIAGEVSELVVKTVDEHGLHFPSGGAEIAAQFHLSHLSGIGAAQAADQMHSDDLSDGRYLLSAIITKAGEYSVWIYVNGEPIGSGPIKLFVHSAAPRAASTKFYISHESTEDRGMSSGQYAVVGRLSPITLTVADQFGNPASQIDIAIAGGVYLDLAGPSLVRATQTPHSSSVSGRIDFRFSPPVAGTYAALLHIGSPASVGDQISASLGYITAVVASAPSLLSAVVHTSGAIFLSFDSATDRGRFKGYFPCSRLLSLETTAMIGDTADCLWAQDDLLVVHSGPETSISLGDVVEIKPGMIRGIGGGFAAGSTALIAHQAQGRGEGDRDVEASIIGPHMFSGGKDCDTLILDASGSYGGMGRAMDFKWGVKLSSDDHLVDKKIASRLEDYVSSVSAEVLEIQPSALPRGKYSLLFSVTIRNWLGASSKSAWAVQVVDLPGLPIIHTPSLQRVGGGQDLVIRADTTLSRCIPKSIENGVKLAFKWSTVVGPSAHQADVVTSHSSPESRHLSLPGSALIPGETYIFAVSASVVGQPSLVAWNSVVVRVGPAPLSLSVEGGNRTVSSSSDLHLGVLAFRGQKHVDPSSFIITWGCSPAPCLSHSKHEAHLASTSSTDLLLPAASLRPGSFRFHVTATSPESGETVRAVTDVSVTESVHVPTVRAWLGSYDDGLVVLRGFVGAALTGEELTKCSGSHAPPTVLWSVVEGDVDLEKTEIGQLTLMVDSNRLTGGQQTVFKMSAWCGKEPTEQNVGSAYVVLEADSAPWGGSIIVTPTNGRSLETIFRLAAPNWQVADPSTALVYDFSLKRDDGTEVPLATTHVPVLSVVIPTSDRSTKIVLRVHSSRGVSSVPASFPIELEPHSASGDTDFVGVFSNLFNVATATDDSVSAVAAALHLSNFAQWPTPRRHLLSSSADVPTLAARTLGVLSSIRTRSAAEHISLVQAAASLGRAFSSFPEVVTASSEAVLQLSHSISASIPSPRALQRALPAIENLQSVAYGGEKDRASASASSTLLASVVSHMQHQLSGHGLSGGPCSSYKPNSKSSGLEMSSWISGDASLIRCSHTPDPPLLLLVNNRPQMTFSSSVSLRPIASVRISNKILPPSSEREGEALACVKSSGETEGWTRRGCIAEMDGSCVCFDLAAPKTQGEYKKFVFGRVGLEGGVIERSGDGGANLHSEFRPKRGVPPSEVPVDETDAISPITLALVGWCVSLMVSLSVALFRLSSVDLQSSTVNRPPLRLRLLATHPLAALAFSNGPSLIALPRSLTSAFVSILSLLLFCSAAAHLAPSEIAQNTTHVAAIAILVVALPVHSLCNSPLPDTPLLAIIARITSVVAIALTIVLIFILESANSLHVLRAWAFAVFSLTFFVWPLISAVDAFMSSVADHKSVAMHHSD